MEFSELLKQHMLKESDCTKQVSDAHLQSISDSSCEDWRKLPAHLELETIVVKDVDKSEKSDDVKRYEFFLKWKKMKGFGATYKQLITVLLSIKCVQDAEKVCEVLKY